MISTEETKIEINCVHTDGNGKVKIIALTGKYTSGLKTIQNFLIGHKYIGKLSRVQAGSVALSTNEFLEKIISGKIIEASCESDDTIWGTDISTLLTCYIYVGIYTPAQIANMRECKNIELLPIVVNMPAESRILHALEADETFSELVTKRKETKEVLDICYNFIQSEKDFDDAEEYLDDDCMYFYADSHKELDSELRYASFINLVKEFNADKKLITNLDNFI